MVDSILAVYKREDIILELFLHELVDLLMNLNLFLPFHRADSLGILAGNLRQYRSTKILSDQYVHVFLNKRYEFNGSRASYSEVLLKVSVLFGVHLSVIVVIRLLQVCLLVHQLRDGVVRTFLQAFLLFCHYVPP